MTEKCLWFPQCPGMTIIHGSFDKAHLSNVFPLHAVLKIEINQ